MIKFSTSVAGSIRVEIQDAKGAALPRFTLEESVEIFGDDLERVVRWKGEANLSKLQTNPVRLRFELPICIRFDFVDGDDSSGRHGGVPGPTCYDGCGRQMV